MKQPRRLYAAALALAAGTALFGLARPEPAAAQPGCQGPASNTYINVVVEGLRNGNGLVAVTLYADNSRKFLAKGGSLYVGRVDASAPTTRMCIHVPNPGVYAIAIYHDENGNRKIDRGGVLGIPTEGFGFSNNPPTIASLPSFRSVRINIPRSGLTTHVKLKYP